MAEGCMPVAREWQAAIGLQDCMVVVGGRVDIPEFEPIPISSDTMCSAVEILWHRPPSDAQPPTGMTLEFTQPSSQTPVSLPHGSAAESLWHRPPSNAQPSTGATLKSLAGAPRLP